MENPPFGALFAEMHDTDTSEQATAHSVFGVEVDVEHPFKGTESVYSLFLYFRKKSF